MADLSVFTNLLFQWLLSPFMWLFLIFLVVAVILGGLWLRKKRKLIYPCIEVVSLGDTGKAGFNKLKCGWYGKRTRIFKLWDYGEEVLKTRDGEEIYDFSTEDFQEVDGKRGVICFRDPLNQNILTPISKCSIKGKEILAEIAPAELRGVALDIIKDAEEETTDRLEKIMQWVMFGTVIIFALVSIIVIVQMVKQGQREAAQLIVDAGDTCLKNAKEVCSQIAKGASSSAP